MGVISGVAFSVFREIEGVVSFFSGVDYFPGEARVKPSIPHHSVVARHVEDPGRYWRTQSHFRSLPATRQENALSFEKVAPVLVATLGGLILGGSVGGVIAFRKGIANYFFEGLVGGAIFGFAIGMIKPEIFE